MAEILGDPMVDALAWSLVHFVWQGAVIAIIAFAAMRATRLADGRYLLGVGALGAMLLAPVLTTVALFSPETTRPVPAMVGEVEALAPPGAMLTDETVASTASSAASTAGLPMGTLVLVWAIGVCVFMVRLGGGWVVARRLARRAVKPADTRLQALAAALARRLEIRRAVAILESSTAAVPMLVGWLKPAVVLPAAALAGLTPEQVEAILAHELAHVRRQDFLVNVLQSVVEAVLFYHPAVWWLSARVRRERELCCDDLAVGLCDRLVYATALTDLAALSAPRVALAATDGNLIGRVRRVLAGPGGDDMGAVRWVPAAILAIGLGVGMPGALLVARSASSPDDIIEQQARHVRPAGTHAIAHEVHPEDARGHVDLLDHFEADAQSAAQREAELVRMIRELEAQLAELRRDRTGVDRARPEARVEVDRAMAEVRDALARADVLRDRMNMDMNAHIQQLEAARVLADKGLVAPSHIRELEAALAQEQNRRADARVRAELDRDSLALKIEEAVRQSERAAVLAERGLTTQRHVDEMKQTVEALRQRLATQHSETEAQRHQELQHRMNELQAVQADRLRRSADDARAFVDERMAEQRREMRDMARAIEVVPDAVTSGQFETTSRVITSGDVLRITISGEPDLPSTYQVRTDGTIRMPLLGSFRVVGQTSQQLREAIGRKLSESRLGSASSVTIQLRRPARVR